MLRRDLLHAATAAGLFTLAGAFSTMLSGCSKEEAAAKAFRVGVTAGPHADIVTEAARIAKTRGLEVEVVEFTDYVTPDTALNDGRLDAAVYQHEPFLNTFNREHGSKLANVADAVVQPMGLYSKRITTLKDISAGASIGIPNDPSNGGRALVLLEKAGLLKLSPGRGGEATVADIVENPKELRILELEAAQLPRSIEDADLACIPMNYVLSGGLDPQSGIYFEDASAPYALIIIAAREDRKNDENLKRFIEAYRSDETAAFIEKTFRGAVRPSWK